MSVSLALAALLACSPVKILFDGERVSEDSAGDTAGDTSAHTGDTSGETGDTSGETGETGETGWADTGSPTVDCLDLPSVPEAISTVPNAHGYHDVIFDDHGFILGSDNNAIIKTAHDGTWEVFVPGLGVLEQMDWLHDGDMVVSAQNTGRLARISSKGAVTTITSDVYAYEVLVGPDGMIYAANNSQVLRVDPDTGAKEVLLGPNAISGGPRVMTFNLDYTLLYIGTLSGGRLYQVAVDEDLNPVGDPVLLAGGLGNSYHDGLGVDVCGNVYLTVYSNSTLYRITPDGQVTTFWDPPLNQYGHGLKWGPGIGGWRLDALYVPRPYGNNTVAEVVIGVPEKGWDGEVLNAP